VRAFLAVPADPGWAESTRALAARLSPVLPRASWTRPESWHLTLKFLGEIAESAREAVSAAVSPVAAASRPTELAAAGSAVFPSSRRPRVLGVGLAESDGGEVLGALARACEEAGRRIGAAPESRPFRPHVTLARLKDSWPPDAVDRFRQETDAWPFPLWPVRACVLYRSRLDPGGAVHTPVQEWRFSSPREVRT
jgi:2'-5' RNA ligase